MRATVRSGEGQAYDPTLAPGHPSVARPGPTRGSEPVELAPRRRLAGGSLVGTGSPRSRCWPAPGTVEVARCLTSVLCPSAPQRIGLRCAQSFHCQLAVPEPCPSGGPVPGPGSSPRCSGSIISSATYPIAFCAAGAPQRTETGAGPVVVERGTADRAAECSHRLGVLARRPRSGGSAGELK
jgi:hypothetical protein